jgi:hypothetical protein
MKTTGLITRRRAIVTGLASVGGLILALPLRSVREYRHIDLGVARTHVSRLTAGRTGR